MVDCPFGEHEPIGDLGVAKSFGEKSKHLLLARRQAGRILPSRGARPPRQPACPAFAQTACDHRRRRPRIQPLKLLQRAPQRHLLVRVRERKRGPGRIPGQLERVWLRRLRGNLLVDPGTPPPHGELAGQPGGLPLEREPERSLRRRAHSSTVALEPRCLGSCRRDRPQPPQLARRLCQRPGLVERGPLPRITAPRANTRKYDQSEDARRR